MLTQVRTELFKLRKRWMPFILLGILVAMLLLVEGLNIVLYNVAKSAVESGRTSQGLPPTFWQDQMVQIEDATALPQGLVGVLSNYQSLGTIMLVILAGSLVGSEYTWGTVRTSIARGVPRLEYLGAKALALLVALGAGLLVTVVAGSIAAVVIDDLIGKPASLGFLDAAFAGRYLLSLLRVLIAMTPYVLLAFALAVVMRGPTGAIAIGLVYVLLEGAGIALMRSLSDIFKSMSELTIGYNASALVQLNNFTEATGAGIGTGFTADVAAFWKPLAVLLAYGVTFLLLAFWSFRSRDLTTGG